MIKKSLLAACLLAVMPTLGMAADGGTAPAAPAASVANTNSYALDDQVVVTSIVIKFKEGTDITVEGGVLKTMGGMVPPPGVQVADITDGLNAIDKMLAGSNLTIERAFGSFSREELDDIRDKAQSKRVSSPSTGGAALANLNNYHSIALPKGTTFGQVKAYITEIAKLDIVETVYPEAPAPAPLVHSGPTGNYENYQDYLDAAPNGMEVRYAWNQPGGDGQDVRVIDIEYNVNRNHEDLPSFFYYRDDNHEANETDHGTAALGIIGALDNGLGIKGIAHGARIGFDGEMPGRRAESILRAGQRLRAGDVMLLEMQSWGPAAGDGEVITPCSGGCSGCVPAEWEQAVFDAVQTLTAQGIVVVASAGNGGRDLDSPALLGRFDRSQRDSGAIIVGARDSDANSPRCYSDHGDRLDVSAWGENVATLGYGELGIYAEGTDNRDYTPRFSGTSSAGALIAGVAASLQGVVKARDFVPLTSKQMRDVLVSTGARQTAQLDRNIGRYPNMRKAIDSLPKGNNNCTVPSAPKNIRITDQGSSWFTIAWNGVSGADQYIALLDTNGDGVMDQEYTTTKTWYPFKRLKTGQSYFAQVKAVNACGESGTNLYVYIKL